MDYKEYHLSWDEILILIIEAVGIALIVSTLFYDSLWGMVICPIVFFVLQKRKRISAIEERKKQLTNEFLVALKSVSGSLLAGFSIENAFKEAQKEVNQVYSNKALMYLELQEINRLVAMNVPLERLLQDFAERTGVEDIYNFADIFSYAKRTGGNFVGIIDGTVNRMWEKFETSREIEVMISAKRLEQKVMNFIPVFILAYMKFSSREYMSALYGNIIGVIFMSVCVVMYVGAIYLAERILNIRV